MIGRREAVLLVSLLMASIAGVGCTSTEPYRIEGCTRDVTDGWSVARVWDEQLLELIRQVVPAPTEHARNLFHTSAAMWDAWAAYDPQADGYFVTEKLSASDADRKAARETAMSFAAYRILLWRYGSVADLPETNAQLDATMAKLCYRRDFVSTDGGSPAALGNRIAASVIEFGRTDGSQEQDRYFDSSYTPVNRPLEVGEPGASMDDPNRWQPLSLEKQISQNGLPIPGKVQTAIGTQWGHVTPFALPPSDDGTPIDPGGPPRLTDPGTSDDFKESALEVIRYSSMLDVTNGITMDIGPGAIGDNSLGSNDGDGRDLNPVTGQPYEPNMALRGDFARVLAEFWADGPKSETPPGHWNSVANSVVDSPGFVRKLAGQGAELDPLEWDVKMYLALNGALHDAAIAAWGLKGHYDSARPISMIRYMGGLGQSTDPSGPSYHPDGLPLEEGLVEVITAESSAYGQPHAHLVRYIGEIAVRAWRGFPQDPTIQTSGVGWIRAVEWVPYQRQTFVTPAFPAYVSGHSTFSRAAAEVLAALTGSANFPGGLSEWTTPAGQLLHEDGPAKDVTLQWATYFDAADQAGISRLFMGIHITADDLEGRKAGSTCGIEAWTLAQKYFVGSAHQ